MNGIFNAALDAEEITSNPLDRIKISVKFAQAKKKPKTDLYFTRQELDALRTWMLKEYQETNNIACIAILFQAITGMRIGEIGALRWSDILPTEISIARELLCDKRTNTFHIAEHTKGYEKRSNNAVPPKR